MVCQRDDWHTTPASCCANHICSAIGTPLRTVPRHTLCHWHTTPRCGRHLNLNAREFGSRSDAARWLFAALFDFRAVVDLVARVEDDLVGFGEAFEDFGFEAVLPADFHFLRVNNPIDDAKHGRVFAGAEK